MSMHLPAWGDDANWRAWPPVRKRDAAVGTIGRVLDYLGESGVADPWSAYHLDFAIKALGDGMYVAAETYARKSVVETVHRSPSVSIDASNLPNYQMLRANLLNAASREAAPQTD